MSSTQLSPEVSKSLVLVNLYIKLGEALTRVEERPGISFAERDALTAILLNERAELWRVMSAAERDLTTLRLTGKVVEGRRVTTGP